MRLQRLAKRSYIGVPKMAQNGSKMTLFKMDWESIGNLLGPFWNHFEAFSTTFEPTNGPNYNGNGPFRDQKRVQKGSKMTLFKMHWEPIGNILGPFLNHFEAFLTMFEPANGPNYNGNGPFWDQKWVQNGSFQNGLGIHGQHFGTILRHF